MRAISAASLLVSVAFAATAFAAAAPSFKIVDRIKVQDGGFDYATYDAVNGRILMARPTLTTVIDTKTGKVSELASAKGGHIAMPIPGSPLLAVTQRAGNVLLVDGKSVRDSGRPCIQFVQRKCELPRILRLWVETNVEIC